MRLTGGAVTRRMPDGEEPLGNLSLSLLFLNFVFVFWLEDTPSPSVLKVGSNGHVACSC